MITKYFVVIILNIPFSVRSIKNNEIKDFILSFSVMFFLYVNSKFLLYIIFSFWRIPAIISYKAGILATDFLSFCLSEKSSFVLHFWRIISLDIEFWVGLFSFNTLFYSILLLLSWFLKRCPIWFLLLLLYR